MSTASGRNDEGGRTCGPNPQRVSCAVSETVPEEYHSGTDVARGRRSCSTRKTSSTDRSGRRLRQQPGPFPGCSGSHDGRDRQFSRGRNEVSLPFNERKSATTNNHGALGRTQAHRTASPLLVTAPYAFRSSIHSGSKEGETRA